jgi:hypothetical protein
MAKHALDPAALTVTTFEPTAADRAAALGADTSDEVCYCFSLLAEDCFGPSAGCSSDSFGNA